MRTLLVSIIMAATTTSLAQQPNPGRPQADTSPQPLQDQSLSRPQPGADNTVYPLPDQSLTPPPAGASTDTSQSAPVSGSMQVSPRVSSGPDNSRPWPTREKDQALTQKIRKNLLNQDANFAKTVSVETRNGVVTLTGQVATPAQRRTVEKTVRAAAGKAIVKSELTVAHE